MGTVLIHEPRTSFTSFDGEETPEAIAERSKLRGMSIGLRTEGNWKSWIRVLERWARALELEGARSVVHLADGPRVGPEAATTTRGVAEWAAGLDVAVSGLGTCGSCTSYTVVDATTARDAGARAMAVVTTEFAPHARSIARHLGSADLPVFELPHPLEGRSDDELDRIADDYYDKFVARVVSLA